MKEEVLKVMPNSKDNRAGSGRLRLRAFQLLLFVLLS